MTEKTKHQGVYAALFAAQAEIKNPSRTTVNPFYKSKYAELPDILEAVKPILQKNDLHLMQPVGHDSFGPFLSTVITHVPTKEQVTSRIDLILEKNNPQAMGIAITYSRRQDLCTVLAIAAEDDNDGNSSEQEKKKEVKIPVKAVTKTPEKPVVKSSEPEWKTKSREGYNLLAKYLKSDNKLLFDETWMDYQETFEKTRLEDENAYQALYDLYEQMNGESK